MKVLVVGGAGYVGTILRPALEKEHQCVHFDLRPVPGAEERTIIGDVTDPDATTRAVQEMDVVLYLAMGAGHSTKYVDPRPSFAVNTHGVYQFLKAALKSGIRRFVSTSTLSVYAKLDMAGY